MSQFHIAKDERAETLNVENQRKLEMNNQGTLEIDIVVMT